MQDQLIEYEGGEVLANLEDRTITGLLIPFGEVGRTNVGRFQVEAGAVELPADPAVVGLNLDHDRPAVVGRAKRVWEEPAGIMATLSIARTPEGDAALADAINPSGRRRRLSAEFGPAVIRGGKLVAGHAKLWGAALVERGAFPSAQVLAADTPDEDDADEAPAEVTTTPADEATTTEGESTVTTTTEAGVEPTATVEAPAQVLASQPIPPTFGGTIPAAPKATDIDPAQVFAAMAQVKNGTGLDAAGAMQVLASLSDIKYNASGGLTTAGNGVLQHSWVGKLWQGVRYTRKYIDLCAHYYGGIALGGRKGFTISQDTALVQAWNGNKGPIPSGTASTATSSSSLRKYGYGADVAREWYDLEGGADVIAAFWEGVTESYALITDVDAMKDIFTAASKTSVALDRLVAPDTYPADYPEALGMLIQGIEAVQEADDVPTFAVVNPAAWQQLIYTPKDLIPEFVSFAFTPGGEGSADNGKVHVVKAADSYFTGLDDSEPAVITGAKNGIEFREQGTTPIQIDAVDVANGGLDRAVVGYLETFVVRPSSLVLIGTEES